MDSLSPERRSWLMSRIGSRNTGPELIVRRMVFAMGFRYRLHDRKLPGRPDLVFAGRRKVIFVHGCFWHGHEGCRLSRTPKTNPTFWREKVVSNRERDARTIRDLATQGWTSLVVWQCELKHLDPTATRIYEFLNGPEATPPHRR